MLTIQAPLETDDPTFCGIYTTITNTSDSGVIPEQTHRRIHCRFCAEIKSYDNELLDISQDRNVYEDFLRILSFLKIDYVDLSEINTLPKTTCEPCYNSFQDAFAFFKKVKQSQTALTNLYSGSVSEPENLPVKLEPDNDESNFQSHQEMLQFHAALFERNKPKLENQDNDKKATSDDESKIIFPISVPIIPEPPIPLPGTIELVATPSFGDIIQDQSLESPKMDEPVHDNSSDSDDDEQGGKSKTVTKPEPKVLVPLYGGIPIFDNDKQKGSWISYTWKCTYCTKKFRCIGDLRMHSKESHSTCFAFDCSDCLDQFNMFDKFIEHVREHRNHLRNYCKYCDRRFDSPEKCETHEAGHIKGYTTACEVCGELCPNSDAYRRHKNPLPKEKQSGEDSDAYVRHTYSLPKEKQSGEDFDTYARPKNSLPKEKQSGKGKRVVPIVRSRKFDKNWTWENYEWTCKDCLLRAPTVGSLRDHTREVHNKCFAMKCVDCLRVMTNYRMFVEHVRKHRPYLRRYCEYCNERFASLENSPQHIENHLNSEQRPCDGCGQIFADNEQLSTHMKKYESPRRRGTVRVEDLTCDVCQKVCRSLPSFRLHRKTHDQQRKRDYTCDSCGKSFYTSGMLKEHIKTHDVKTEVCEICKKKFHTKPKLKAHVATHSGLRPYPCNECGKCFRTDKRLKVHLLLHTDIKPFKCLACGKEFRYKIGLKVHENQHTGLRPYPCERCEKTFANWANCNKHMIRKHGLTLAKTKLTALGRLVINRETGQPTNISADEHAREWMDKIMKRGKGIRGKRRPSEPSGS